MDSISPPTFSGFLKASGHAEVWDDTTDEKKFQQFGWRSTTNESSYSTSTLIGNWNEEKFDVGKMMESKPLPSQYSHYYQTTYQDGYSKSTPDTLPSKIRTTLDETLKAFPGHQPVLDSPEGKQYHKPFTTTSREAYGDPDKTH